MNRKASKQHLAKNLSKARKGAWTPAARAKRAATLAAKRGAATTASISKRVLAHGLRQKLADVAATAPEDAVEQFTQRVRANIAAHGLYPKNEDAAVPKGMGVVLSFDETRRIEGTIEEARKLYVEMRAFFERSRGVI